MGRLYVDATGAYTDPTQTSLKYFRADGTWSAPDMGYKFADAAGEYTVPELWTPPEDIASASWADVIQLANLAAADPESYTKHLGQEKTLTIGGKTVTARIVEVGRQKLANGGVCGFVFNPYRGMGKYVMNTRNEYRGNIGYPHSSLKTWLEGREIDPEVSSALQTMEFKAFSFSDWADVTIQSKISIMSSGNVFSSGDSKSGERYRYFAQNDTNAARIHYDENGSAYYAWLLDINSIVDSTYMKVIDNEGKLGIYNYSTSCLPSARFCLGSSV